MGQEAQQAVGGGWLGHGLPPVLAFSGGSGCGAASEPGSAQDGSQERQHHSARWVLSSKPWQWLYTQQCCWAYQC